MAQIAIDDSLYAQVAELAHARRRPVEQQAEEMLRNAMRRRFKTEERRAVFDAIAGLTPPGVAQTDSVLLLREDRDR